MNDPRDNEQTDKEMIERIAAIGRAAWDARVTADNAARPYPGPPLITFADLDRWAEEDESLKHLAAERFEPTDDDYINWREADDYADEAPYPDE